MKKKLFFFLVMFVQALGWGDEAQGRFVASPDYIRIKGSDTMAALSEDLGISVPGCEKRDIVRVSRKNNSGTHAFFRGEIFPRRQHFHINLEFVGNSEEVVQRVAQTPCAIGYSSMGFVTATVKTLCLTQGKGSCIPPTPAFALNKSYPLTRPLYMVTLGPPTEAVKDYLQWIVGPAGQEILRKFGFVPIPKVKEIE